MRLRKKKQKKIDEEENKEDSRVIHESNNNVSQKNNIAVEDKPGNPPQNNIRVETQSALIRTALQKIGEELQTVNQSMYGDINVRKSTLEIDEPHANCWNLLYQSITAIQHMANELATMQQYLLQQNELSMYQQQQSQMYAGYMSMNPPVQNNDPILQRENLSE